MVAVADPQTVLAPAAAASTSVPGIAVVSIAHAVPFQRAATRPPLLMTVIVAPRSANFNNPDW